MQNQKSNMRIEIQKKIMPEAVMNLKVSHTHHFLLAEREAAVLDIHLLFVAVLSPHFTFSLPAGGVAEIAAAMTSLWDQRAGQVGGSNRACRHKSSARQGLLTGDCATFLRVSGRTARPQSRQYKCDRQSRGVLISGWSRYDKQIWGWFVQGRNWPEPCFQPEEQFYMCNLQMWDKFWNIRFSQSLIFFTF